MNRWMIMLGLLLSSETTRAEVADSAAGGFTVKHTVTVAAPVAKAWAALIEVRSWWSKEHTWSGDAANLSIEAKPGGCFCEKLAGGGGVRHMTVVYAAPGQVLRMTGGLGPLQEMAVSGVLTAKLSEAQGKTTLELAYAVGGYAPSGLAALAKPVDAVIGEQVARWKRRVETGKP